MVQQQEERERARKEQERQRQEADRLRREKKERDDQEREREALKSPREKVVSPIRKLSGSKAPEKTKTLPKYGGFAGFGIAYSQPTTPTSKSKPSPSPSSARLSPSPEVPKSPQSSELPKKSDERENGDLRGSTVKSPTSDTASRSSLKVNKATESKPSSKYGGFGVSYATPKSPSPDSSRTPTAVERKSPEPSKFPKSDTKSQANDIKHSSELNGTIDSKPLLRNGDDRNLPSNKITPTQQSNRTDSLKQQDNKNTKNEAKVNGSPYKDREVLKQQELENEREKDKLERERLREERRKEREREDMEWERQRQEREKQREERRKERERQLAIENEKEKERDRERERRRLEREKAQEQKELEREKEKRQQETRRTGDASTTQDHRPTYNRSRSNHVSEEEDPVTLRTKKNRRITGENVLGAFYRRRSKMVDSEESSGSKSPTPFQRFASTSPAPSPSPSPVPNVKMPSPIPVFIPEKVPTPEPSPKTLLPQQARYPTKTHEPTHTTIEEEGRAKTEQPHPPPDHSPTTIHTWGNKEPQPTPTSPTPPSDAQQPQPSEKGRTMTTVNIAKHAMKMLALMNDEESVIEEQKVEVHKIQKKPEVRQVHYTVAYKFNLEVAIITA